MENIFTVIALILASGFIAIELGITTAILELIAGIIAGNFLSFHEFETLNVLADFGLLAIMYLAGLEIDTDILRKHAKSSIVIGTSSFIIPFMAIFLSSFYFLGFPYLQSVLIAITLSSTSIAIVYSIIARDGRLSDMEKQILSATMVVDVLCMASLSIIFSKITEVTLIFVVALFFFALLVPNLGRRIFKHYKGNAAELEFRIVLFIILGIGLASELVGLEAVILAFVMGVITSAFVVEHEKLWDKLRSITFGFVAPIFFFKVGTTVSVQAIVNNVVLIGFFFIVAFITKYLSTMLPAKKYIPTKAKFMGVLFNARLSFGIVAATLGFEMGIFNQDIYSTMIGVVILSSIVSSSFLGNGLKKKKS